ncbi:MAG: CTP synthase [Parcubacteria group bacterium]
MKTNFIFVAGGVMSGVGKGIATASTARILKDYGYKVTAIKIDPYLNVDAGTMNPTEHGEVFVTKDGLESDQDLGNYERFLGQDIIRENYLTTGLVYLSVINRERNLGYEGKCVEVIPHVTGEIERRIKRVAHHQKVDFVLIEIGGTVGEYQNLVYLEAARIMKLKYPGQVSFILVSYFPVPNMVGEMKTKPTQHAVRALNSVGIQPDIILARSTVPLDDVRKLKVSTFCNVSPRDIISAPDISTIYQVPINFERDHLGKRVLEKFGLKPRKRDGKEWRALVRQIKRATTPVKIGIVGKYFGTGDFVLSDSYISVIEAIKHGAWANGRKPEITWINAEQFESSPSSVKLLDQYDAIIVPGGFGKRGVVGKLRAIRFVREHDIPYLGLCYGLQLAVVEFARNVCGLTKAHTTESDPRTKYPVIHTMADQVKKIAERNLGGTMRLGHYACRLNSKSLSRKLYGKNVIWERHRHRFEVNPKFLPELVQKGLFVAGVNPGSDLVELIENPANRFFVASQFHPEFQSRPLTPHPLFVGLVAATKVPHKKKKTQ